MIGTLQIRILRLQQQPKNFSVRLSVICDSRIWVMSNTSNLFNVTDWILHCELSHLVLIPQNAKTVVPTNHHAARWCSVHKDPLLGCAYSTAGRDKVYDQGKRILCTLDETGKPMAMESRKVDCRRFLMAVTEMTDCGRWVCFGQQRQGFSVHPRTGQKIEFTSTPGRCDLTMKLEPPERANKIMNKAIQEITAKRRAAAIAKDYGAVTDTDGLVRCHGM